MSIVDIILSKRSLFWSHLRCVTANVLQSSVATTNLVKSLRFTDFTTNACANTETPMSGSTSPTSSTTCPSQPSLTDKFSACMEVLVPASTPSTILGPSIACKRYPMRVPCATFCGLTPTIGAVGVSHLGAQGTPLGRTFQKRSITATD